MWTLEPVYPRAGGSAGWVEWFMDNLIHQPALAFGYTQAGQENSFGWDAMKTGLKLQIELLAKQAKAGEIQVQTLAQSGEWFRQKFPVTPPTAVVYLTDWKNQNRKAVWYNSRFYRVNFLWQYDGFYLRDLHRFDESIPAVTHDRALTESSLEYGTIPIMDGARWSGPEKAGIWPVLFSSKGEKLPLVTEGPPMVTELNPTDLSITQPLRGGGSISIVCNENRLALAGVDAQGQPLHWAMDLLHGAQQKSAIKSETPKLESGSSEQLTAGQLRLRADRSGKLAFRLGN